MKYGHINTIENRQVFEMDWSIRNDFGNGKEYAQEILDEVYLHDERLLSSAGESLESRITLAHCKSLGYNHDCFNCQETYPLSVLQGVINNLEDLQRAIRSNLNDTGLDDDPSFRPRETDDSIVLINIYCKALQEIYKECQKHGVKYITEIL
mgnify:CR=1 FL=1